MWQRVRWGLRVAAAAGLGVTLAVATNQILDNGKVSWTWLYLSVGVAVIAVVLAEGPRAVMTGAEGAAGAEATLGGRRVYLRQLRAEVKDMETVGIATQSEFVFRMRQVYVDVSVAPKPAHEREPYVGAVARGAPVAAGVPGERQTLKSFLFHSQGATVVAVLGGPGTGKTTLARHTALSLSTRHWHPRHWRPRHRPRRSWHAGPWRRRPVPVLLYLRDHAKALLGDGRPNNGNGDAGESAGPPGLAELAVSTDWLRGKVPARWLRARLDRGRCLVLLDGLDEVADADDRRRVVAWVTAQIRQYPGNQFVVTSRPHGYDDNRLPNAEVLQVRRFTSAQIGRFLHNWSYATECRARGTAGGETRVKAAKKADELIARLRQRPGLYELATNPLLLTMIATVHRYRGQLPGSRAALYAEMCEVLLHRRYEDRGLANPTGLSGEQKEVVMRVLALAMMRGQRRDMPLEEACQAIREPLREVSGDVSPEVFLTEVCKTGLLVERDHSRLAFAHLTLQEYLAAAHIGESGQLELLTGHVDHPWWRETTLLWAATANASPVVRACLDSGTVRALALAFDCVDEARQIDPDLRSRLEALLSPPEQFEEGIWRERLRLIAGVHAARGLRETIAVGDDAALCVHPVNRDLWALFVNDERAAGRHTPLLADAPSGNGDAPAPAMGMWSRDAARFVTWLNSLFDDGTTYRLPSEQELTQVPLREILAPVGGPCTVWTDGGTDPVLHQPDGAPWPYKPDTERLVAYPPEDRKHVEAELRLIVAATLWGDRMREHLSVLITALRNASDFGSRPELAPFELMLNLALVRDLDRFRALGLDVDLGLHRVRDLALGRVRDLALDLALDVDLDRAFGRDVDLARVRALGRARDLGLGFGLDLDLGLGLDVGLGRVRALALDLDLNLGLDRDLDVALDVALALDSDRIASTGRLASLVAAFSVFIPLWEPPRRRPTRAVIAAWDTYLARLGRAAGQRGGRVPESIPRALSVVRDRLSADQVPPRAIELVSHADRLISRDLDRHVADRDALVCGRLAVLAASALLRAQKEEDAAGALEDVWRGLVALEERERGQLAPNEVLLLVRA